MWVHLWTFRVALVTVGFGYLLHSLILMRVSDGAINWDDFDGAPVASLPTQFRMLEIESTTLVASLDASHRFREASYLIPSAPSPTYYYSSCTEADTTVLPARYVFESSFLEAHGGWFADSVAPRLVPQPMPLRFRMDLHCSYHQGPGHDMDHCTALRHAIKDLVDQGLVNLGHLSVNHEPSTISLYACNATPLGGIHHIDFVEDDNIHMMSWHDGLPEPIVLNDGYEVDTVGSLTSTPFSLISDWKPFELTPTTPSATARQGPPVPFILWPNDDDLEGRDVQIVTRSGRVAYYRVHRPRISIWSLLSPSSTHRDALIWALSQIRVDTTTTPEGPQSYIRPIGQWLGLECLPIGYCYCPCYAPSDFDPFTQTVRAYDSTKREVMGLGRCQHGPMKFVATVDHDTPFGLGFVSTEVDYRGSEVHPHMGDFDAMTDIEGVDELQHQFHYLQLGDETSSAPILVMIAPSSPDRASFLSLCFPEETTDYGVDIEPSEVTDGFVPRDEYWDEMDYEYELDCRDGTFGFIDGASDFVDPPLSFDILSRFISCSDDVYDFVFMDLSIFEYLLVSCDNSYIYAPYLLTPQILDIDNETTQPNSDRDSSDRDSDPIDEKVSLAIGDAETIDFGTEDQPRELKIGSPLSTDERDRLIHLLRSYLDVFAWSYEDMSVVEYLEWLANVIQFPKRMARLFNVILHGWIFGNAGATYQRAATTLFHDMMHRDVEVYVDDMIVKSRSRADHLVALERFFERIRKFRLKVDPDKIKAILDMPVSRLRKRSGVFWASYSILVIAFEKIEEYLLFPPVLVPPMLGCPLLLYFSISDMALGCMLAQLDDFEKERDIYYLSKKMLEYEMRYVMIERFCLALVWATRRLRYYMTEYSVCLISRLDPLRGQDDLPWYHEFISFLDLAHTQRLPQPRIKGHLRHLAARFVICGETLYRRSADGMLLLCLDRTSVDRVMRKVHAGVCGPHMGGHMLA
ncbi:hypothetical protein CK203_066367 [Vitis vinifera]|uniref:Uncharacterized protein n=1 Tax=Vitis vinifera TaxID=29760 RepID=A0A438G284_VITVI|nr:hypothetical protein CK203_066367 [Vitis vinifera]